jgi:formylglycine-generating enzyme required for sulfatase activity
MAPAPDLAAELQQSRQVTDSLFDLVHPEAMYERPIPERHRLIFYLGHLEAFDWNLIAQWWLSTHAFHADFDRLFAFGIDPDESGMPHDRASDWPVRREVEQYKAQIREKLDPMLEQAPAQLLHVAIEHRLMHVETLAYLLHNLDYTQKIKGPAPCPAPHRDRRLTKVEIPPGDAILGRPVNNGFGWDNEFREYADPVPGFTVGRYKVTNREYLAHVLEGGTPSHFWTYRHGEWFYRGMFGEIPLPPDAPVYVTHEQATAYAKWFGGSLPTEAQWHRAAEGAQALGNLDFHAWDPVGVDATPEGDSRWGVAQTIGNGWEWTSSVFAPFDGFEPFPFYRGYSADFFDGKHFVLKGASPRTAARMARHSFRNWFRPRYPYLYATFRVVEGT